MNPILKITMKIAKYYFLVVGVFLVYVKLSYHPWHPILWSNSKKQKIPLEKTFLHNLCRTAKSIACQWLSTQVTVLWDFPENPSKNHEFHEISNLSWLYSIRGHCVEILCIGEWMVRCCTGTSLVFSKNTTGKYCFLRHFMSQETFKVDRIHRKPMIIDSIRDNTAPSSLEVCQQDL